MFEVPQYYASDMPRGRAHNFPRSVDAALLNQRLKFDTTQEDQAFDFIYYREFSTSIDFIDNANPHQTIKIPDDYYFHLEEIRLFSPRRYFGARTPGIYFKVWQISSGRELSDQYAADHVMTTPDANIESINAASEVAAPIKHAVSFNYLFLPSDTIKIALLFDEHLLFHLIDPIQCTVKGIKIPKTMLIGNL